MLVMEIKKEIEKNSVPNLTDLTDYCRVQIKTDNYSMTF